MLVVVGLSHHTAPVEVRERAAFDEGELDQALQRAAAGAGEALVISTCNRVEFYLPTPREGGPARARELVGMVLRDVRRVDPKQLEPHLYLHDGEAAVRHLFRVASSLDSMVVGEPQILGQVKEAFQAATRVGTVGQLLGRALPRAFQTAKRVRTETQLARQSASMASAAVELARHIFGQLQGRDVLVIGAGKMGDVAAKHLTASGAGPLLVVNRTLERAQELAARIGGEAHPWQELDALLARADIVLCSTGATEPVVKREMVQRAMKTRRGRWLFFIDIAVPRDVEPEVGRIENVYLYDVDALQRLVADHLAGRAQEAEAAERIVGEEVERFFAAERSLGVVPTIKALRERFLKVAQAEAARSLAKLDGGAADPRRELQALSEAIVNKLLHGPLTALKREADSEQLIAAARTLFDLQEAVDAGEGEGGTGSGSGAAGGKR
jgi:glutamyl-tRNA reductase